MKYIDSYAIQLGDVAYEIGDFKLAHENYSKALKRLRNYQGDRMQAAHTASDLVARIEKSSRGFGKSILKFDHWRLTKSSFVKGEQCVKNLYLDKHKPKEKTPFTKERLAVFDRGRSFEDTVRENQFPGGINVKEKVGNFAYFNSFTQYLLDSKGPKTIYEATLIEEGVLVMCDILVKNENGKIDVYEIKLNSQVNDAIIADLAVQYAICKKRFQSDLNSFNLILRTEDEMGRIENLTTELDNQFHSVCKKMDEYKSVLVKEEPKVSMGNHCTHPYECQFIAYCEKKSL